MSLAKMTYKCFNSDCDYITKVKGLNEDKALEEEIIKDGGIVKEDYKKCPKCGKINTLLLYIE